MFVKSHSTATTKLAPQENRQGYINPDNRIGALDSFPACCCQLFKRCNGLVCANVLGLACNKHGRKAS